MDKELIQISIKRVFTDRLFLALGMALIVTAFVYSLVVGFNIHVSDVTVYTRYTAFGEAHFYKDHWQYLLTFLVFGIVVAFTHLALMVKLHAMDRRQTAIMVGWAGIGILVIACMYAIGVMSLGRAA